MRCSFQRLQAGEMLQRCMLCMDATALFFCFDDGESRGRCAHCALCTDLSSVHGAEISPRSLSYEYYRPFKKIWNLELLRSTTATLGYTAARVNASALCSICFSESRKKKQILLALRSWFLLVESVTILPFGVGVFG